MKQETIELLKEFIKKSTEIDDKNTLGEIRPCWLYELIVVRNQVLKSLKKIRNYDVG